MEEVWQEGREWGVGHSGRGWKWPVGHQEPKLRGFPRKGMWEGQAGDRGPDATVADA